MKQVTDPLTKKRQLAGQLLNERGLMAHKAAVLSPYGVERIRDLDARQFDHLIDGLMKVERKKPVKDVAPEIRKGRSVVLSLLDDLGIKPKKGNWQAVNDYLKSPKIAGKVLYEMTEAELKACAKRLRVVKRWKEVKVDLDNRLARDN